MGTGRVPLKVNSKGKKNLECMEEMHAFMQCFARSGTDGDAKCVNLKTALDNCAAAAAKKGRQRTTINYHLGRLSRLITKSGSPQLAIMGTGRIYGHALKESCECLRTP